MTAAGRPRNPSSASPEGPTSDRQVDDWHLDEVDWFGEEEPSSSEPHPQARRGLIPAVPEARARQPRGGQEGAAITRRRRILGLAVIGGVCALGVIVPLVVFGGGGGGAERTAQLSTTTGLPSPTPTTTAERPTTTTAQTATTPTEKPLRISLPNGRLGPGDRGPAVVTLQRALAALSFATGPPDGTYGGVTKAAVVDFQQSNNLTPDGVVGADTARLLNAALVRRGIATSG
ncbi:MAG: peptidoglycan-binding domain-containing protein [Verrucomicrobiota bacterium]